MIHFSNVSVSFDSQPVLVDVNLHIKPGEFVCLVGETGVGKTTLLRLIYFDVLPNEGMVKVGEYDSSTIKRREIPRVRRKIGVVFQDYKLLEERNVYDNVAFVLEVTGVPQSEISRRVLRALANVGLSHKRNNMLHELSGGEQQRAVFARALVNEPLLLLADEPTGNLDLATSLDLLQLMKSINQQGTTVILATHNHELVRRSGGRIVQIREGRVSEIVTV